MKKLITFDREKFKADFYTKFCSSTIALDPINQEYVMDRFLNEMEEAAILSKRIIDTPNVRDTDAAFIMLLELFDFFNAHFHKRAYIHLVRNFRATLPEDKYTPITELLLTPVTSEVLQRLGVKYIGELEIIAYWHDEEMSLEYKERVINSIHSPNKNLLSYKQANVRCSLDEEGNVTNLHDEDVYKLAHVDRPIELQDIVYNANRLSYEAYIDIDKALERRENK